MQIIVRDNNVDQALRALKKKLQREGVYREMKLRRHYEKPSEKRARERAAAIRRARKLERKRAERDGVSRSPVPPKDAACQLGLTNGRRYDPSPPVPFWGIPMSVTAVPICPLSRGSVLKLWLGLLVLALLAAGLAWVGTRASSARPPSGVQIQVIEEGEGRR